MSAYNTPTPAMGDQQERHAPPQPPRDTSSGSTNVDDNDGEMDRCGHCGTLATTQTLQLCTGCRQRAYCNRSCQLVAWQAGHKKECKLLKADAETKKNAANISAAENEQDEPKENNTDPPDGPSAEPANGPACAEPEPDPGPDSSVHSPTPADIPDEDPTLQKKSMKKTGGKTMWVHVFKCFDCGKEGHDLSRCAQCEEAFYCDRDCETRHAKAHGPVCTATVAAKARRARRERVARAVRESGKAVEGAEEDMMCVICQAPPVKPVKVRLVVVQGGNSITC